MINFGNTPKSIENNRKRLLIYTFGSVGGAFILAFALLSLFRDRLGLGVFLLIVGTTVVTLSFLAHRLKSVQPVSLFLAGILLFLSCFILLGGGVGGTGAYWSYMLSMLMVLLVGPLVGLAYLAVYLVVIFVGLLGDWPWVHDYESVEVARILSSSVAFHILLLASEWLRVMSYGAITSTSEGHRHMANTDPLTGALNRAGLKNRLGDLEDEVSTAIVLIDIDHFKQVNDQYGHEAGDWALVNLSIILHSNTKGRDLIARWGGEEFLLVFPQTSVALAAHLVDSMREQMASEAIHYGEQAINLSFSAGVAEMDGPDYFEQAVRAADRNLYKAKAFGRNRVVTPN